MFSFKKIFVFVLGVAAFAPIAFADTLHIGVVDIREVATKSKDVSQARTDLQKKFKSRHDAVLKLENELKTSVEKFKRDMSVMTSKDKQKAQQKIIQERQNYALAGQSYEEDLMKEQRKLTNDFLMKVKNAIEQIAKKEHFDLVLQKENVPFAAPSLDITQKVIKQMG